MKLSSITSRTLSVGTLSIVLLGGNAYGSSSVVLNSVNSGYYSLKGQSSQSLGQNRNITTLGSVVSPVKADLYHNWMAFDLTSVEGNIVGAILEIYSSSRNTSGQTIKWWDVTTPYSQLGLSGTTAADTALGKQIYADTGGGTQFGEGIHTAGSLNSFELNESALAALNATESFWAIGGQNTMPNPNLTQLNHAFGYTLGPSETYTIQLKLEIAAPEPPAAPLQGPANVPEAGSTLAMLGIGVLSVFGLRKRLQSPE